MLKLDYSIFCVILNYLQYVLNYSIRVSYNLMIVTYNLMIGNSSEQLIEGVECIITTPFIFQQGKRQIG